MSEELSRIFDRKIVVDPHDLKITNKSVLLKESTRAQQVQELLKEALAPRVGDVLLHHYTSLSAAKSIISSGLFRLTWLKKRAGESEVKTFLESVDYPRDGVSRNRILEDNLKNIFYASFTSDLSNQDYHWNVFGNHGKGVRLDFHIQVYGERAELRKLCYEGKNGGAAMLLFIRWMRDETKRLYGFEKEFIIKGISWLSAFFLIESLLEENESRLLIRRYQYLEKLIKRDKDDEFVEIPFSPISYDMMPHCFLSLQSIAFRDRCSLEEIRDALGIKSVDVSLLF